MWLEVKGGECSGEKAGVLSLASRLPPCHQVGAC